MDEELQKVLERVSDLEKEVALLKQQLARQGVASNPMKEPAPTIQVAKTKQFPDKPVIAKREPEREIPSQPTVKKEFDLEKVLSTWLPRVFMFILLLGVLWGLKVGMDHGFITTAVRVALGYAGTILLYYLGMRYYTSGKKGFGLTLLGGFIGLGILTTFAAHHLYGYLSFMAAFVIGVAYIIAGLLLSRKTQSETLTIFSGIAGFLLPFLLEGTGATAVQFCLYILLLFLSLFYVSISQKHKITFYVMFLLFHFTLFFYAVLDGVYGEEWILVGTVLIQHSILLFFYLRGSISKSVFSEALLYTNFVMTIGWVKMLDHVPEVTVYGLFALLYSALAIYSFWKKDSALRGVLSAVALFAVCVFILAFDLQDERVILLLLILNGTMGIWIGLRYRTVRTVVTGSVIYLFTIPNVLTGMYFETFWSLEHIVWLVFLASVGWLFYTVYRYTPRFLVGKTVVIDRSLIIGQVFVLIYVNKLTRLWLASTSLSFTTELHVQWFVLLVVLCAMYVLHRWQRGLYIAHGAVLLFLVTVFGVVLWGVGASNRHCEFLFNLIVQFAYVAVLTALIGAIVKDRFYVTQEKLKVGISGLAVLMQIIYFIFLNKWFFAIAKVYAWELEYILFVHTFLLFAFAFLSISAGGKLQWKPVKFIGAGLIVVCVLKLFIIDLASISILVRAILFTIVGVVGLAYSRTLLKEEK
ncbi:DUF2339 domain-containing protein [Sporosarcina sp. ACRSM]|uniref:DUF2339 domain-containing protein n=1 Tax=Sporosarcina sp. ACRSM TaxID=2918216 RepID=UPI001EF4E904|nr:DUF2339 domain-containing protein [Sporosarcina sp. ACRSM]MCG7336669.1 DUF2339 domain-containing protein [Sporosarcina sp. ACRSM]